jgi:hypothetical protein
MLDPSFQFADIHDDRFFNEGVDAVIVPAGDVGGLRVKRSVS